MRVDEGIDPYAIRMRVDEGIDPYAKGENLPFNGDRPRLFGVPSTPGLRATLSKQERARRIRKENKTMIHATFTQDAQKGSVTMEMQGHALTAPKGEDLICAAATMLVYTLGQAVQFLYEQGRLLYEPQMRMVDGYAKITVYPRKCAMAETLMAFWVAQAGAYVLERNYPKAVDLMPMEVSA